MKRSAILLAALATVAGCGEQDIAGTRIKAGPFSIQDTKDNRVKLVGKYNPATGEIDITNFELENNASKVNPTIPGVVIANAEYRRAVNEGVIGETNAIFGGMSGLVAAGTPLLLARQQAKIQQQAIEATQPQLIDEVVGGILGGKISLPGLGTSGLMSPGELAQVKAELVRIQQDIAAAQAAEAARPPSPLAAEIAAMIREEVRRATTSQPVEGDHE